MGLDIDITGDGYKDLMPKFKRALDRTSQLTALEIKGNIAEFAPVKHGNLARRWDIKKVGDYQYTVATNVVYAAVQNWGRDPFTIYPRRKKALHFFIGGNEIFCKRVNHPGIKGKFFVEKSIDEAEKRIDDFIYYALGEEGLI